MFEIVIVLLIMPAVLASYSVNACIKHIMYIIPRTCGWYALVILCSVFVMEYNSADNELTNSLP